MKQKKKIIFFGGSKYSSSYRESLEADGRYEVRPFNKLPPVEEIKSIKPDLGVIAYFGQIIPEEYLKIPAKGFINVHYSLLPHWRGPAPLQFALLHGDKETGVTVIKAVKKVDAGEILASLKIFVAPDDTYLSLENKLIPLGSKLLLDIIPKYLEGSISGQKQDESEATYSKILKKEDGLIDWSKSAEEIERMVRAFDPWPGTYTKFSIFNGQFSNLKIKKAKVIKSEGVRAGTIFKTLGDFPAVVCGKDALKLLVVQPEGKKEMPGDAFLRGYPQLVSFKTQNKI